MIRKCMFAALAAAAVSGCEAMKGLGINVGDFGRDSEAMVGGGAKAGQDYITGLSMSENARQYFTSAAASSAQPVTVSRGNDNGTGVTWTDDGGIVIPPGTTIQFANKGYCMDPHLPAPKAGDEMQFVKTSSLVPNQLRGTYKNLLERAANGDSEVQNNMQRLVWALRTAGSEDGYANNLTDRQRQILAECADENGSFESYQLMHKAIGKHLDWAKSKIDKWTGKVNDALQIKVGNFSYNALDLLDPDKAQQRVSEHLQTLIAQSVNLPVSKSGFNYGELAQGVYTDVKGNGTLSFQAKVANATSQPYTFYPMDYAAQVGSGRSQSTTAYFATSDETMRQRITMGTMNTVLVCTGTGEGERQDVTNGTEIRLSSLDDAVPEFVRLIAEKTDRTNPCVEYYALVVKRNDGTYYMSQLARGELKTDAELNSHTTTTPTRTYETDEKVMVIHSHPADENFSAADVQWVQQSGNMSLVLVDQESGRTAILNPQDAARYNVSDEGVKHNGVRGRDM